MRGNLAIALLFLIFSLVVSTNPIVNVSVHNKDGNSFEDSSHCQFYKSPISLVFNVELSENTNVTRTTQFQYMSTQSYSSPMFSVSCEQTFIKSTTTSSSKTMSLPVTGTVYIAPDVGFILSFSTDPSVQTDYINGQVITVVCKGIISPDATNNAVSESITSQLFPGENLMSGPSPSFSMYEITSKIIYGFDPQADAPRVVLPRNHKVGSFDTNEFQKSASQLKKASLELSERGMGGQAIKAGNVKSTDCTVDCDVPEVLDYSTVFVAGDSFYVIIEVSFLNTPQLTGSQTFEYTLVNYVDNQYIDSVQVCYAYSIPVQPTLSHDTNSTTISLPMQQNFIHENKVQYFCEVSLTSNTVTPDFLKTKLPDTSRIVVKPDATPVVLSAMSTSSLAQPIYPRIIPSISLLIEISGLFLPVTESKLLSIGYLLENICNTVIEEKFPGKYSEKARHQIVAVINSNTLYESPPSPTGIVLNSFEATFQLMHLPPSTVAAIGEYFNNPPLDFGEHLLFRLGSSTDPDIRTSANMDSYVPATCFNGRKDGSETDVDCGISGDPHSNTSGAVRSGSEGGENTAGSVCPACKPTRTCLFESDCIINCDRPLGDDIGRCTGNSSFNVSSLTIGLAMLFLTVWFV